MRYFDKRFFALQNNLRACDTLLKWYQTLFAHVIIWVLALLNSVRSCDTLLKGSLPYQTDCSLVKMVLALPKSMCSGDTLLKGS